MTEPIRLSKRVADLAGCSRREAELYLEGGWVQVNGQVVEEPQHRVASETVTLDKNATAEPAPAVTLLWHRPGKGVDCDAAALQKTPPAGPADQRAPRVLRRHFANQQAIAPLDGMGSGLVVFTQDGRIRRRLLEDAALLEQEFMVELPGQLTNEAIEQLGHSLQRARVWRDVPVVGKVSMSARGDQGTRLRFALKGSDAERVYHLCASQGLTPQAIRRTRLGRVAMAGLAPGQWRYLGEFEKF